MRRNEKGAVSIFIVVLTALLITIVTISFMRLMIQTAQESSTVDLSQSAYDAALDGVEDAKRAIATNRAEIVSSNGCSQVSVALGAGTGETLIAQDESDEKLSQAYTCVTVDFESVNVQEIGVEENTSILIPLNTLEPSGFNTVRVAWKRPGNDNSTLKLRDGTQDKSLPQKDTWESGTPALLRIRYIWADSSIDLNDYTSVDADAKFKRANNSRTKFLVPSDVGLGEGTLTNDSDPTLVSCNDGLAIDPAVIGYECAFHLTGAPSGANNDAPKYIQITPLYASADIDVTLINRSVGGNDIVSFNGVQAVVDSTGRAGDVFRRVQARVRLDGVDSKIGYPSDALTIGGGDLCKDFFVTDVESDYSSNSECPN